MREGDEVTRGSANRAERSGDRSRVLALTDAVFAIIITLLVLDIHVPELGGHETLQAAISAVRPSFISFVLTFIVASMQWVGHRDLFTRERYEVPVFEQEAPLLGGRGVRVTPISVEPTRAEDAIAPMSAESSRLSNAEDAVAWYGAAAVPLLADTSGFCAALLYADWAAGRLISETVWQDPDALAASRRSATAGEAAAAQGINGVLGASAEYRLVFSSARPA